MKKKIQIYHYRSTVLGMRTIPVIAILLAGMYSCSNDTTLGTEDYGARASEMQTSPLVITTASAEMPATVLNYGFDTTGKVATRGIQKDFVMPDIPDASVYANLPELQEWQQTGTDCIVSGQKEMGFQNLGQNVYVTGHWTLSGTYGSSDATIWVLPGATLEFTGNGFEAASGNITIYNYGTLSYKYGENQCRLGGNLTVCSASTIDCIPNLNLACGFITNGAIKVKRVHFNNSADVYVNCKIEATEEVIFDNEATFHVGYIKSPKVTLMACPKVVLRDGGYIETDELNIHNTQTSCIYSETDEVALIKAGQILVNNVGNDNLKGTFRNMNILCNKWIFGEDVECNEDGLGLNASVRLNADVDVILEETEDSCAPILVLPKDEEDIPSLETIATITNNHSHPISATSIQFDGDKAYVSWHERGNGIHGCIEVVENTPEGIKLLAYAEDPATDYNHIIVDGNRLLAVGHNAKNAIVGEIALVNGSFVQGETLNFTNLKGNKVPGQDNPDFYGGDGNCIIRNGDYISVASYGGLHTLNSDLTRMTPTSGAVQTTGSAKHLSIVGNKILELNLTSREKNTASSPAELRLFDATDYEWMNPSVIASDLTITPVDGKNTIALDKDGSMYVCLGFGGIRKYVGNTLMTEYVNNNPANGLAIDDKYVYVANGKELLIFIKNDLSQPVLTYSHTGLKGKEASCNYVAVNGNLIYLAYGTDGVDVLRMNKR